MDCALDEVYRLLNRAHRPLRASDPAVRYLCALFSELAYYHVPAMEIDSSRRAKLVPCGAYRAIVRRGQPANAVAIAQQAELRSFVVTDRAAVALGVTLGRVLFIAIRGTQFLFDWRINFRAGLVPRRSFFRSAPVGRFHGGFLEEALRISTKLESALRKVKLGEIDQVFLTGHSLGGAIAAIAQDFISVRPVAVCVFGAPRYSDVASSDLGGEAPRHVQREGDLVPTIPPRFFGYIDQPGVLTTRGGPGNPPFGSAWAEGVRWVGFLAHRCRSHSMEQYRKEVGQFAAASFAEAPLCRFSPLTSADLAARP